MGLPLRRVELAREAVYSLLAFLKRHKARKSPRAIRFALLDGRAPRLVLEPWEQPIESRGTLYRGPGGEPVRIWGRQRLLVLARLIDFGQQPAHEGSLINPLVVCRVPPTAGDTLIPRTPLIA